ncbi:MAG: hypothetical protein ACPGJR_10155 [Akkermansiaceae bacterium]
MAPNISGLTDEDGYKSDWSKISNPSDDPVNFSGWWLTYDASDLTGLLGICFWRKGRNGLGWADSKEKKGVGTIAILLPLGQTQVLPALPSLSTFEVTSSQATWLTSLKKVAPFDKQFFRDKQRSI